MRDRTQHYIDGAWVASTGSATIDVVSPVTEEVIGRVAEGTPEDVAANPDSYTGQFLAPTLTAPPSAVRPRKRSTRKK